MIPGASHQQGIGRRFPPGLLAEVAEDDDDAESLLRPLLAADLVMANAEDSGYEFRNAER